VGPVVLIFLVFCVVVFGGGSVVLIFLAFCVVVFGGGSVNTENLKDENNGSPTKYYNTEN
jgi:hypothetical protein